MNTILIIQPVVRAIKRLLDGGADTMHDLIRSALIANPKKPQLLMDGNYPFIIR